MLNGRTIAAPVAVLMLIQISGADSALGQPDVTTSNCRISGAEKLPHDIGGARVLCEVISKAARTLALHVSFTVDVRVLSPSMLAAVVTLTDGRRLPEQKMVVSDGALQRRSVERFADAIALQAARTSP
ncbi:MAG: hypothetical protein ABIO43_09220 [Sphingomicrobium sp.]